MTQLPVEVRSSVCGFAFVLASGKLEKDVLDGIDYRPALMQDGSGLEMAFTVYTNNLVLEGEGEVYNDGVAYERAAQWVRHYCDPSYHVDPPFEPWEIERAGL